MDELPNGWHYRHRLAAYEFWWDSRCLHTVSEEAWEDFQRYIGTRSGRLWAMNTIHSKVLESQGA